MKNLWRRRRMIFAALSLAIVAASSPAHAVEPYRNQITIPSTGELQNLNNRERRLDYQQLQQINREQDSQIIRPQRLKVPVMKPRCPLPTSGTPRTC